MLTRPTPLSWEILCAMRVSASSSTLGKGTTEEVMASVRIGASAGLVLLYIGGTGRLLGRKLVAALMAACTSCSATSMLRSSENCKVISELLKELIEVICV